MTLSLMIGAAADLPNGYFNVSPEHDESFATRLVENFGFKNFQSRESIKLSFNDYPTEIGAYEKAFILCDERVRKCCTPHDDGLVEKALNIYPLGSLFILVTRNSTNYFRYRLFEQGALIRDHGGDLNDGVTVNYGPLLPQERSAFEHSKIIDGQRIFYEATGGRAKIEEYTVDAFGEELGLKVAARFFGERVDPRHNHLPSDLNGERFL